MIRKTSSCPTFPITRVLSAPAPAPSAGTNANAVIELSADAARSVQSSGALRVGDRVEVRFDPNRMPASFRIEQGGYAQWGVSGQYRMNGGDWNWFTAAQQAPGSAALVARPHVITVSEPGTLELRFQATDRYGHVAQDPVRAPSYPFIVS